jgi:hypothetical protein
MLEPLTLPINDTTNMLVKSTQELSPSLFIPRVLRDRFYEFVVGQSFEVKGRHRCLCKADNVGRQKSCDLRSSERRIAFFVIVKITNDEKFLTTGLSREREAVLFIGIAAK